MAYTVSSPVTASGITLYNVDKSFLAFIYETAISTTVNDGTEYVEPDGIASFATASSGAARQVCEDRREDCPPWPIDHPPDGRGRDSATVVRRYPRANRPLRTRRWHRHEVAEAGRGTACEKPAPGATRNPGVQWLGSHRNRPSVRPPTARGPSVVPGGSAIANAVGIGDPATWLRGRPGDLG